MDLKQEMLIHRAIKILEKSEEDPKYPAMTAQACRNYANCLNGMAILYGVIYDDLEGLNVLRDKAHAYTIRADEMERGKND